MTDTENVLSRLGQLEEDFDAEFVQSLIEMFVPDTDTRLGAMHLSIVSEDRSQLQREAHGLKGSAGNLGAIDFAQMCADLEIEATSISFNESGRRVAEMDAYWIELKSLFLGSTVSELALKS